MGETSSNYSKDGWGHLALHTGFSVEFCTAVALVVTGVTLIYTPFGRVTWAHRAQAARGVRGHAPGNFLFKMLRNAFSFILGAYFLIFSKQV